MFLLALWSASLGRLVRLAKLQSTKIRVGAASRAVGVGAALAKQGVGTAVRDGVFAVIASNFARWRAGH
jgi:hypothetical protein